METPSTPILSVPGEILGEIFIMCTDTLPIPHPDKAPIIFTRISRWFRHVALTTPRLWSDISLPSSDEIGEWITFHENPRYKRPQYLALIGDWLLVRSGATPLNITFLNYIGCHLPSNAALLEVIFSCTERWQNIDITKAEDSLLHKMAMLHESHTPCLRSMSIALSLNPERVSYARILMSPKFQQLTIQSSEKFTLHPDMSWTTLTDINLDKYVGPVFALLRQAKHLRSLHLDPESFRGDGIARSAIDLPELVSLHIGYGYWNGPLRSLFAHLSSPRLEDLGIHTDALRRVTPSQLVGFIGHTNRLKTLYLRDIGYQSLVAILRSKPELKELSFEPFPKFTRAQSNDFFNAFVAEDVNERVCAHLEDFICSADFDPDEETVRRLYERKLGNTPGISAWKNCYIDFAETRCAEVLRELGASREIWTCDDVRFVKEQQG